MSSESSNQPRSLARKIGFSIVALSIGIGLPLLAGEIVCRLLPVATAPGALPVNTENPVFRFTPNRTFVWSLGWRFSSVNRGRVNNDGFINDQDYDPHDQRPLLAVIGDSYVEALMVPYSQTFHGRAGKCMGPEARVYSFAASGAPLSQYLVWARYAREHYAPKAMAFVIVGNDFDESLAKYKTGPGFHHFAEAAEGAATLVRYDYSPTSFRKIVRRSALARYLVLNLHLESTLANLWRQMVRSARAQSPPTYVGNTAARNDSERLRDSERAVVAFLDLLPAHTALDPAQVLFLVDGVRPQLYGGAEKLAAVQNAYFPLMRRFFIEQARSRGYEVADLQPLFQATHESEGVVFEFEDDAHWNAKGHELVTKALLSSSSIRRTFATGTDGIESGWPDSCLTIR